jgi:hypothetical protein
VFEEARHEDSGINILRDLRRIVWHWPIYPAMLIQLLWQFSPAIGTVLQYHIVDHLHATDTQWGLWQGTFFGSFIPIYTAYVDNAMGAVIAAAPMGLIGGLAQASLVDLTIRSAPRGSQGAASTANRCPVCSTGQRIVGFSSFFARSPSW